MIDEQRVCIWLAGKKITKIGQNGGLGVRMAINQNIAFFQQNTSKGQMSSLQEIVKAPLFRMLL